MIIGEHRGSVITTSNIRCVQRQSLTHGNHHVPMTKLPEHTTTTKYEFDYLLKSLHMQYVCNIMAKYNNFYTNYNLGSLDTPCYNIACLPPCSYIATVAA